MRKKITELALYHILYYFSVWISKSWIRCKYMIESYSTHWEGENKGVSSIDLQNLINWPRFWDFFFFEVSFFLLSHFVVKSIKKNKTKQKPRLCLCLLSFFSSDISGLLGSSVLGKVWGKRRVVCSSDWDLGNLGYIFVCATS